MSVHEGNVISLAEVEREIASGARRLAFAPRVEAAFESASEAERLRVLIVTGIAATILYDMFIMADWITLNDMAWFTTVARLGIFTPSVALALFIIHRKPSTFIRESIAIVIGMLAVLLPMLGMAFSESSDRLNFQYGSLLVMMFSTVVQRPRFRFAVVGLTCMLGIQLATTYWSGAFDAKTYLGIVLFFITSSVLLALTTYFLEQAERRSFLFAMRGELLREQIEVGARTDALTGLFNRRHLGDVQREIWAAARTAPRPVSAILLDIDHFKLFNDSRGHMEGDACLRTVSDRVAAVARENNGLAFRFGGEEFLVLLPGLGVAEAVRAAEAIRVAIEGAAIPHPAVGGIVTASLGVAGGIAPETTADELIAAGDTALYAAKRCGRNQVQPPAIPRDAVPAEALAAA